MSSTAPAIDPSDASVVEASVSYTFAAAMSNIEMRLRIVVSEASGLYAWHLPLSQLLRGGVVTWTLRLRNWKENRRRSKQIISKENVNSPSLICLTVASAFGVRMAGSSDAAVKAFGDVARRRRLMLCRCKASGAESAKSDCGAGGVEEGAGDEDSVAEGGARGGKTGDGEEEFEDKYAVEKQPRR
ncbi:uncharacterized protein MONOS_10078 [Monocercomonoides exilis]|uniref:uncharacterized protein n=1 Tax=Monocercomonoides exilis TaxID=2049356 RepID=UPI0035596EFC|nr:hypothetical protein MONOS_10078 [Monocercomonoides exilis]|eukprot:MONOS_10078.1-p1 / transcript=MONOS_10078.1 / gene=MONOS_10078 / organism=Monocercomonoides_exilis_PA203 / gene_product=unspecified product / transcript_product=unspecified product / location=Mono_scaffold00442:26511-27124(-) / protein_length=186 / sequence_SO=supercontig / SO=protein_coding / is_pseudo=false